MPEISLGGCLGMLAGVMATTGYGITGIVTISALTTITQVISYLDEEKATNKVKVK